MKLKHTQVQTRIKTLQEAGKLPPLVTHVHFNSRVGMGGQTLVQIMHMPPELLVFGEVIAAGTVGILCEILRQDLKKAFPDHNTRVSLYYALNAIYLPHLGTSNELYNAIPLPWDGELQQEALAVHQAERDLNYQAAGKALQRFHTLVKEMTRDD